MLGISCALLLALQVIVNSATPASKHFDVAPNKDLPRADTATNYRLPSHVKPVLYTVMLEPNIVPNDFTFAGESRIDLKVVENTSEIVLHAKDLKIDEKYTSLWQADKPLDNTILSQKYDNVTDFYTITFGKPIAPATYKLLLKYTGLLHDDMNGFYRSSYTSDRGEEIWLATTQFEPTWARRAFPCFDEPALKARFNISIKHADDYRADSNMPAISMTRPENDTLNWWTQFEITPVMSTYLVAFIVSDFAHLSSADRRFRVFSRDNAINMGQFAQKIGPHALQHLENYTSIKHVIPKMDNFAIPQFRAGAMENWGIVTYRESRLLFEENVTSTDIKQGIATVISHEFAHQWFGNLVSPSWWKFTWLNEGFANYFEYFTTDKLKPKWHLMDQFVIKNLQETAFMADDNETQHAMDVEVNSPREISTIFDSISYSKAGSVIRMFSHALKEDVFRAGLQKYLTKHQYSATSSDDLFNALEEAAGKTAEVEVKKAFISWARQPGYPVIAVNRNYKTGATTITQQRFLTKPTTNSSDGALWYIPINYASEKKLDFDDTRPIRWLQNKTHYEALKTSGWVIFNRQQTGYYRVNYDNENWKMLADYLKNPNNTKDINVLNRAQLLDDSFNLAQAGHLKNHLNFLELSVYLQHEEDYVPWYSAHRAFAVLDKSLANTEKYFLFKLYIRRLVGNLEKTLGYQQTAQDEHISKLKRLNIIKLACTMGSPQCLRATHDMLVQHVVGSNKISPELRNVVLCAGIRSANATIWETMYNITAETKPKSDERKMLVNALGCSSDQTILQKFMEETLLTESKFDRNDVVKAVYSGSPTGVDAAFTFLKDSLDIILDHDGDTDKVLKMLNQVGSRMTTDNQVKQLEGFINSLPADSKQLADALKAGALSSAKANVQWLQKYEPNIVSFLIDQKLTSASAKITASGFWLVAFAVVVTCLGQR